MAVPEYQFEVVIGNSGVVANPAGIVVRLRSGDPPAPVDMTGSEIVFRAILGVITIRKTSTDGGVIVDLPTATITVPLTAADTRKLVVGQPVAFELERRDTAAGLERTLLRGQLVPIGGINDDIV